VPADVDEVQARAHGGIAEAHDGEIGLARGRDLRVCARGPGAVRRGAVRGGWPGAAPEERAGCNERARVKDPRSAAGAEGPTCLDLVAADIAPPTRPSPTGGE